MSNSYEQMAQDLADVEYASARAAFWAGHPHIAARVYNTPLMIHPEKALAIESVLRRHAVGAPPTAVSAEFRENRQSKPYQVTEGGTAVISVYGTLVHRAMGIEALSGLAGYTRLATRLQAAVRDRDVERILLDIDSPGGEVSGLYDLTSKIVAARGFKPVWGIANESAFSAAYAIGSAVTRLVAPQTADVGSIGVIAMHVDQSVRDEKQGMHYTAIYAGAHKNDFNPHQPLKKSAATWLQKEVDRLYTMFVEHVATYRSLSAEAVSGTEAGVFNADDALDIGLIDEITGFDEVIEAMESTPAGQTVVSAPSQSTQRVLARQHNGGQAMSTQHDNPEGGQAQFTQADLDRVREEGRVEGREAAHAEGYDEGMEFGTRAERERIQAILTHEQAEGRVAQAIAMALETDLNAEQAGKLLARSPKQDASPGGFEAAMARLGNPDIDPDGGRDADDPQALADSVLATVQ